MKLQSKIMKRLNLGMFQNETQSKIVKPLNLGMFQNETNQSTFTG
jgi:hypothetical protein